LKHNFAMRKNLASGATRLLLTALVSTCFVAAQAEILYRVRPLQDSKQVSVEVSIPKVSDETIVQIPRWMPGFYVLQDYGRNLKDFAATGANGQAATVEVVDDHTWKVRTPGAKSITISYKAPMEFADGVAHYGGAPTYIYVVGRIQEKCRLHLELPQNWRVAVGLDGKGADYRADDYDVLADNSVTMGNFIEETYKAAGKIHTIALRGPGASKVDMPALRKQCEFISNIETDFMGGAPYNKYVWHFTIGLGRQGGSGIEHLSSTNIGMGSDITKGMAGLLAHEFFHLWNVKRIRSKVLGPFDYTKLPKTGALWWLEGVTEYFSSSLLARYGWTEEKDYLADVAGNVQRQRSKPERLKVSPFDTSFRVDETNGGRGNSDGYGLSYYDEGFVLGLCLDLELLAKTNGKKSLDDVEFALWRLCRNGQPGFEEGEIRKQLIAVGGDSFGPLYDQIVMQPGELPVETALAYVGLELNSKNMTRSDIGFQSQPNVAKSGMEVTNVRNADIEKLLPKGTIIRAVNNRAITGASPQELRGSFANASGGMPPGTELNLKVLLPGQEQESSLTIKMGGLPYTASEVRSISTPSAEQLRLRAIWLAKKRSG
jgi:predicted metalloprotease with PDZ domain